MKRLFLPQIAAATVTLLLAAACDPETPPQVRRRPGFNPPPSHEVTNVDPQENPQPRHREVQVEEPKPESNPDPKPPVEAPAPPKAGNYEYGKAVNGRPGFVTSPYAPTAGYVDVRGFPPGTEVKDPYTQKVFLVP